MPPLALCPLITAECTFDPTIDDVALLQIWGKTKTRARNRLAALKRYEEPVQHFLHLLDDLVGFVKLRSDEPGFWSGYHPDGGMRDCGDLVRSASQRLLLEATSSPELVAVLERLNVRNLNAESQRYLGFIKRDSKRNGAYLSRGDRAEYKQISDRLVDLSQQYVLLDKESGLWIDPEQMQHLPQDFQDRHELDPIKGNVRISTNADDYNTFVEWCNDDKIPEKLYRLRESRAPKNELILRAIVELADQKAKILGYLSFPHYAMELGMMRCPEAVRKLLVTVNEKARPEANNEKAALSTVLRRENRHLDEWNVEHAKRKSLESHFPGFDPVLARSYFPLKNTVMGAMNILGNLFCINFRQVDTPSWHSSVLTFDVYDMPNMRDRVHTGYNETYKLGRLYVDLISREGKFSAPCAIPLRSGALSSTIKPEICLSAALGATMECHIGFQGCANILHELGHCVHFLMAQTSQYYRFSGFSNELDFLEVPSLLLEELLRDLRMVSQMAINLASETIPPACHRALVEARDLDRSLTARAQTLNSLISLDLHADLDEGKFIGNTTVLVASLHEKFGNLGYTAGTNMQRSFSHLIDYDCRYHIYVYSQMIVKDMATRFLKDVENEEKGGLDYRKKVLEPGAMKDATELVKDYLGRDLEPGTYLRWLEAGSS